MTTIIDLSAITTYRGCTVQVIIA